MAFGIRNSKNVIVLVIVLFVFWMIFWFVRVTNVSINGINDHTKDIEIPTIEYEFSEKVHDDTTFKHLNKNIFKDEINDDQQAYNDNDMDYIEFNNIPKSSRNTHSVSKINPFVTNKASRVNNSILIPAIKTNIVLNHPKTVPSKEKSKDIEDYHAEDEKNVMISKDPYILMHNAKASKVVMNQELPMSLPVYIPKHSYIFTSERFPKEQHLHPSIGNGFIGTVIRSPYIYISGIYNGKNSSCHKAAVPSTSSFNISGTDPTIKYKRHYSMDVSTGVYSEESTSESFFFVQKFFAHRTMPNLLITEVDYVKKQDNVEHVTLKIDLNKWHDTQDFTFHYENPKYLETSYKVGKLNAPETSQASSKQVHLIYDHVPKELVPLKKYKRCKWVFLTAYGFSREEVENSYDEGKKLLVSRDELYSEHVRGWSKLWREGRIDIEGDAVLASSMYSGYYHLLSSVPLKFNEFVGVSASGLPFGNESHPSRDRIKADQELFVFPPLLLTHVELSKNILLSRNFTSGGGYANARRLGFNGLAFPYECATQGVDLNDDKTGTTSPHVTAAVLFAIRQYLHASNDISFLNKSFFSLVHDAADYLHSRLTLKDKVYHVMDQIPIDESRGRVHDSISTNALIINALDLPHELHPNKTEFSTWKEDASKLFLPKLTNNVHAYHAKYSKNEKVGEADVMMLNFPLMMNISRESIEQDLNHYEKVLLPESSPMSKALLAINWLDVGKKNRADLYLQTILPNFVPPFETWSTHKEGIIPNHLPAIGAMLQTIIFGYGGFRVKPDRLEINPTIPMNVSSLHFVGVDYHGYSMNLVVYQHEMLIMVTKMASLKQDILYLIHHDDGHKQKLELNVQVPSRRSRISIVREVPEDRVES